MKVIHISAVNENSVTAGGVGKNEDKSGQVKNGSLYAGKLKSMTPDRVGLKREQARKRAAQMVMDQFVSDNKVTDGLNGLREKNDGLKAEITGWEKEKSSYTAEQEKLKAAYGISDDCEEQKDLELILKARAAMKDGSLGDLSKEELERVAGMGELTEYQTRVLAYEDEKEYLDKLIDNAKEEIRGNNRTSSAVRLEMLKNDKMVDAENAAEKVMEAAAQDIIGMLYDEVKEHIDEEMEKLIEAAKDAAEKKEEEEEKLDAAKEEKAEQEKLTERLQESVSDQNQLKSDIDKILKEAELLEEDMKGLVVDGQR